MRWIVKTCIFGAATIIAINSVTYFMSPDASRIDLVSAGFVAGVLASIVYDILSGKTSGDA